MLNQDDAKIACSYAFDEIRYHLDDLPNHIKNRAIKRIDELESYINKLLQLETEYEG